jgi:DNA-binding MarR family transcriptional regulator
MSNKVPRSQITRRTQAAERVGGAASNVNGSSAHNVDLGVLPSLLGYQLRLAQRAIFADFADTLGEHDVSPGLFGMLVVIEANPGLKQSQLARAAHLDRSSLVPALDKLEARGLVSRRASEHDRRVNGLWLTDQGTSLLKTLKQRVARHEQRLARGLSRTERDQLVALLARIFPEKR